jgi:signal peptidase I
MKSSPEVKKPAFIEWRNALVFAVIVATLFRWSLAEAFVIPTSSMENSLLVGDYILVSKVHYGPRTPNTPLQIPLSHQKIWGTEIPSYLDWIQLPSFRIPGFGEVERGETVVFNAPKDLLDPTARPMDLMTYLVKRCVAISGDEIEIRDKQVFVNGELIPNLPGMKFRYELLTSYPLQPHHMGAYGLDSEDYWFLGYTKENKPAYSLLLTAEQLEKMQSAPFKISLSAASDLQSGLEIFPASKSDTWTIDNYGPLTVPKKGMQIQINASTLDYYGELITKFEGQKDVLISNGKLEIGGKEIDQYTFRQDYYFMMGDSRHNSIDSRYWGFAPEDHIVGKPVMVLFSKNAEGKGLDKVRWERIFKLID